MTIILFIVVLFVTVLVHEWGHFYAARKSGMKVEEFGFGIPPKLFSWKRGEVEYSINALPIGGFVRIAGENGVEQTTPPERQFDTKPWYLKSFVLIAGVCMNLVLAVVLFTAAYSLGVPGVSDTGTPTITSVSAGSFAHEAGIRVGDEVRSVTIDGEPMNSFTTADLRARLDEGAARASLELVRGKEVIVQEFVFDAANGAPRVGVAVEPVSIARVPFFTAVQMAFVQVGSLIGGIFNALGNLLSGIFTKGGNLDGFIGPVGLAREVGGAATIGFGYLLAFTAIISVNLAVLNILPFPALDGGRLLVVLLEALVGRRFPPNVVALIHGIGFLLLLLLMVVLTVGDIRKLL